MLSDYESGLRWAQHVILTLNRSNVQISFDSDNFRPRPLAEPRPFAESQDSLHTLSHRSEDSHKPVGKVRPAKAQDQSVGSSNDNRTFIFLLCNILRQWVGNSEYQRLNPCTPNKLNESFSYFRDIWFILFLLLEINLFLLREQCRTRRPIWVYTVCLCHF